MMSFWVVPRSCRDETPWSSALTTYSPSSQAAGALIVIDVFMSPCGMPSSSWAMCPRCDTGTPTYEGLPLDSYVSLFEMLNPMHRLWSDGRWNKLTVAHGCYWKKCTFCDVSLDYIGRYDGAPADVFASAVGYAEHGFPASPLLAASIGRLDEPHPADYAGITYERIDATDAAASESLRQEP